MRIDDQGLMNLVGGIVKKAVDDWMKAKRRLRKHPTSTSASYMVTDCERFFLSEYFYGLTGVNGEEFLKQLEAQEEKEYAK